MFKIFCYYLVTTFLSNPFLPCCRGKALLRKVPGFGSQTRHRLIYCKVLLNLKTFVLFPALQTISNVMIRWLHINENQPWYNRVPRYSTEPKSQLFQSELLHWVNNYYFGRFSCTSWLQKIYLAYHSVVTACGHLSTFRLTSLNRTPESLRDMTVVSPHCCLVLSPSFLMSALPVELAKRMLVIVPGGCALFQYK